MSGQGFVLWLTGLSGAGKTTISARVAEELRSRSVPVEVLDGDVVRMNLSSDLGFSHADRETNIRRIAFVAELLSRHGVVAITAAISPYRSMREEARARIGERFVEVFVEAPLATCEERDPKGLYARARAGEIASFTGIDDPYEEPLNPEVTVHTGEQDPEESALEVIRALEERGLIEAPARAAAP